ncbi:MAG TPA: methylated-DNA--[protein]-cysteine S-methyltransferase [Methylomirabilota bacterium]|jgi:methylated-DNA-[protein]-cysteine S-methyltransferase
MSSVFFTRTPSPLGPLLLVGTADALTQIWLPSGSDRVDPEPDWVESAAPLKEAARQLEAYFAGALRQFDLTLAPEGTAFQLRVWRALLDIPYGETVSYAELARRIGRPSAVRAVGAANGQNPLSIVIPCHRVIGSDGRLVGYGGGLPAKSALLALERRVAGTAARPTRPRQGALFG